MLWEIIKQNPLYSGKSLTVQPARLWRAVTGLFSSCGDSDSELRNLSTQLTKLLLAGHYHTNPMLQNTHNLLWCTSGKPMFCHRTFLAGTQSSSRMKENATQT